MTRPCVYRHYDANGNVLYVGSTVDATARNAQHRSTAKWWDLSAEMIVTECDTTEIAREFERREIARLLPLYNVHDNPLYGRAAYKRKPCDHPTKWQFQWDQMCKEYKHAEKIT